MNKIINQANDMVPEMLAGYLAMYGDMYEKVRETTGLIRKPLLDKVSIVIGGGAGNEPWIMGYVGRGLADGAALGAVYTAPPARSVLNVSKAVPQSKGILYLCTNHAGDVLNFELVRELADLEGIQTSCVYVADDITTAPVANKDERRGISGIALVVKIAGAASEAGLNLAELTELTRKAASRTYSISVTTSPGYMPGNGQAMCQLPEGKIEYGMGFNGERGILRTDLVSADEMVRKMYAMLKEDMQLTGGERVAVMINGLGATSLLELCIVARKVHEELSRDEVVIHDLFTDNLFNPQGTGGFTISVIRLSDEMIPYYDAPAYSPFYKKIKGEDIKDDK